MRKMTSDEIRNTFLEYFKEHGHTILPSASLLIKNDPTLLWNNAGVTPLKKYFDGPYKQENIARYRQMMEDVRIESANMTYRRIGRKKEQQQRTEQDDKYVRRFINNLR